MPFKFQGPFKFRPRSPLDPRRWKRSSRFGGQDALQLSRVPSSFALGLALTLRGRRFNQLSHDALTTLTTLIRNSKLFYFLSKAGILQLLAGSRPVDVLRPARRPHPDDLHIVLTDWPMPSSNIGPPQRRRIIIVGQHCTCCFALHCGLLVFFSFSLSLNGGTGTAAARGRHVEKRSSNKVAVPE